MIHKYTGVFTRIVGKRLLTFLLHGHFRHKQVQLLILSIEPLHWNQLQIFWSILKIWTILGSFHPLFSGRSLRPLHTHLILLSTAKTVLKKKRYYHLLLISSNYPIPGNLNEGSHDWKQEWTWEIQTVFKKIFNKLFLKCLICIIFCQDHLKFITGHYKCILLYTQVLVIISL